MALRECIQVSGTGNSDGNYYKLRGGSINDHPAWQTSDAERVLCTMDTGKWGIAHPRFVREASRAFYLSEHPHMGNTLPTEVRWGVFTEGRFEHIVDVTVQAIVAAAPADPRWNRAILNQISESGDIAFVRVGWLRVQAANKDFRMLCRQEMPPEGLHEGVVSDDVQVAYVHFGWASAEKPDPDGISLQELIGVLNAHPGFDDRDLLFIDFSSVFQHFGGRQTPAQLQSMLRAFPQMHALLSNARILSIILPWVNYGDGVPFLERGWTRVELMMAIYTHRVLYNKRDREVAELLKPSHLQNFCNYISSSKGGDYLTIINKLQSKFDSMVPPWKDNVGFEYFCQESELAWLRISYLRELSSRGGPFPRRQELNDDGFVVGPPPRDARAFSISHGWETEVHPSPSGGKLRRLLNVLDRLEPPANDDDVVFLDFASVTQEKKMGKPGKSAAEYFRHNGITLSQYRGRSERDLRKFLYTMYDMGRLYAMQRVEVVVLPDLDPPETFPGGDTWGAVNKTLYQNRGWCALEFSIALFHNRIANIADPEVQKVVNWRPWPKTAKAFEDLLERKEIAFTYREDWEVVKYNFYKMTADVNQAILDARASMV